MPARHARPVPRDLPSTPGDARDTVDRLDAKVDAEMGDPQPESRDSSQTPDRAPESPAPEPPD